MNPIKYRISLLLLVLLSAFVMASCEKNDVLPDYELVGTSTATIASISVSDAEPVAGEEIVVTLYYVNLSEDPATEIRLLQSLGDADFTEVTTLDESSAAVSQEITRTFTYTVPSVDPGTGIDLDMVLSTQREFPQRERVSLEVAEE